MSNYLIIVNPYSGHKQGLKICSDIKKILLKKTTNITVQETKYNGHAVIIAQEIEKDLYTDIIIIGGDGTFSEVVNGIMKRLDNYKPNLGFVPGGTGNSFMHDLNCLDPKDAMKPIMQNNLKYLDVIEIDVNKQKEYSINIIGWGAANDIGKTAEYIRWVGSSRYTWASIYSIIFLKRRKAELIIDGNKTDKKFVFILICNTKYTGTGMLAAPKACLDDGLFDVIILHQTISRLQMLNLLPKIFTGEHIKSKHVEYIQAKSLSLQPYYNESLNIDGEIKLKTPIKIQLVPRAISYYSF